MMFQAKKKANGQTEGNQCEMSHKSARKGENSGDYLDTIRNNCVINNWGGQMSRLARGQAAKKKTKLDTS